MPKIDFDDAFVSLNGFAVQSLGATVTVGELVEKLGRDTVLKIPGMAELLRREGPGAEIPVAEHLIGQLSGFRPLKRDPLDGQPLRR